MTLTRIQPTKNKFLLKNETTNTNHNFFMPLDLFYYHFCWIALFFLSLGCTIPSSWIHRIHLLHFFHIFTPFGMASLCAVLFTLVQICLHIYAFEYQWHLLVVSHHNIPNSILRENIPTTGCIQFLWVKFNVCMYWPKDI